MNEELHQSWLVLVRETADEEAVVLQTLEKHAINTAEVIWINRPGENLTIDDVRSMVGQLAYNANSNKTRCFVISQIESGSLPAQHAVLKSLEEPPANTLIIVTTNRISDVLPTIRSRCKEIVSSEDLLPTQTENNNTDSVEELYHKILHGKYFEVIQLAGDFKDRDQAYKLITQMTILVSRKQLPASIQANNTENIIKQLQLLLETSDQLQHNTNVRLTLENCFMALSDIN